MNGTTYIKTFLVSIWNSLFGISINAVPLNDQLLIIQGEEQP